MVLISAAKLALFSDKILEKRKKLTLSSISFIFRFLISTFANDFKINRLIMKILLLGSGGREHALAWKIAQSERVEKLFIAPGNAGTSNCGENVNMKADDFEAIKQFVVEKGINMVVVGPEDPLVKGIYDDLKQDERTKNIPVIGPSKAGAVLEGSKGLCQRLHATSQHPHCPLRDFRWRTFG